MKNLAWIGIVAFALFFGSVNGHASGYPPVLMNGCVYNPDGSLHTGSPRLSVNLLRLTTHPTTGQPIREYTAIGHVASPEFTYDNIPVGCFRLYQNSQVKAGQYVLQVSETFISTTANVFHDQDTAITIGDPTIAVVQNINLVTPRKFITGTVVDTTGKPAAGQLIQGRRLDNGYNEYWNNNAGHVKTAADGTFTLAVSTTGGSIAVDASGDGITFLAPRNINLPNRQVVTFANDDTVETKPIGFSDLNRITADTKITGQILDLTGTPVKSNEVTVYANLSSNFSVGSYAVTDDNGKFSITVAPGLYTVRPYPSQYDANSWDDYAQHSVNVIEGQTYDLGVLRPTPSSTSAPTNPINRPTLITQGQNTVLLSERSKRARNVRFNESFSKTKYYDSARSQGVYWSGGSLVFPKPTTILSNTVRLASVQTAGVAVSKVFTPKGLSIRSVLLNDYLTASTRGSVTYGISPDGDTWQDIVPGQPTNLPVSWNTKNGLRWRATGVVSGQSIVVKDLTIHYSINTTVPNPKITKVTTHRKGSNVILIVHGKGFSKGSIVYLGSKAVTNTVYKNSKALVATFRANDFLNKNYTLTVIGGKLEIGTASQKINPRRLLVQ